MNSLGPSVKKRVEQHGALHSVTICFRWFASAGQAASHSLARCTGVSQLHCRVWRCNPKVLGESPKMGNSQKWLGEGAKGLLSPGSENGLAPVQNAFAPVQNGLRMVRKTPGRLLLPGLKRPFAPLS